MKTSNDGSADPSEKRLFIGRVPSAWSDSSVPCSAHARLALAEQLSFHAAFAKRHAAVNHAIRIAILGAGSTSTLVPSLLDPRGKDES